MESTSDVLDLFHPLIAQWFREDVGEPTDVQARSWAAIARDEHSLITAPTGSGKTLAAFLWAINGFVTGSLETGRTRVLYVSPLKALNNDIRRNLSGPLEALRRTFGEAGQAFPEIQVLTRSGDTPQSERRRMVRRPPEILITTPESLNILLSSRGGRSILTDLSTVILDEIHAVFGQKRGVHLITAVDRLVPMSGEFQRIGLSATVKPIETVAEFVGGFTMDEEGRYEPRSVQTHRSEARKAYELAVRFPEDAYDVAEEGTVWDTFVDDFVERIGRNRSTLIFANNRRLAESLTQKINEATEETVAYAHHGSLSREIREEVERQMKAGDLRAIVATNSLEMGIDIGDLDEVLLVQSPSSVSAAIQRVGRAGHQVGEVSRGTFFPTHPHDILDATVLTDAVLSHNIEAIRPVLCPLDVLAQVIVSMVGVERWDIDALYARIRTSFPYRDLQREHYDLVLNMLAGRYRRARIRELKARVSIDALENTVQARPGALQALYMSGGTIPDRGYYQLRTQKGRSRIGELDEEFVWEAAVGQMFTFGTQSWRIQEITHNDVLVEPASRGRSVPPFWRGEGFERDFHFSDLVGRFLEDANGRLDREDFDAELQTKYNLDPEASSQLIRLLSSQRAVTRADLPHRHHLLVERVDSGPGGVPGHQIVLHTFWGNQLNRPFGLALEAALEARYGVDPEIYVHNNCIVLVLPEEAPGEEILSFVTTANLDGLLRRRLERSGFFGARFRESAGRALLLEKRRRFERMPLWMSRLKSQKLLSSILEYEDFPILLEAWRTCLQDAFDLEHLHMVLAELESGSVRWSETETPRPSPFAGAVTWRLVNQFMYMDDAPKSGQSSSLSSDLIRDVALSPGLRPRIPEEIAAEFERKRQRLSEGYSPQSPQDLLDWAKERLLIPEGEWADLLAAMERDHDLDPGEVEGALEEKITRISPSGAGEPVVIALEQASRLRYGLLEEGEPPEPDADEEDRDDVLTWILGEWLQFYAPKTLESVESTLGVDPLRLARSIEELAEAQRVVVGDLVAEGEERVCDRENLEVLLRLKRAQAVPSFEALETRWLPVFLAQAQGLLDPAEDFDGMAPRVDRLVGYCAPAGFWESEILPARAEGYSQAWMDRMVQEGGLCWVGTADRKITICYEPDLDLLVEEPPRLEGEDEGENHPVGARDDLEALFSDSSARYGFSTLLSHSRKSASALSEILWDGVWQGRVTNDSFAALRRGVETQFRPPRVPVVSGGRRGRTRRRGFDHWRSASPFAGNWYLLPEIGDAEDLLEHEERLKDRVRVLLDRYGILFRELLLREAPGLQWSDLFRSLRLMELSGEVVTGHFFEGISGPQFMSHQAFRRLRNGLSEDRIYWMNAADPASACGLPLESLRGHLPRRVTTTHTVFRGPDVVLLSRRNGKILDFAISPDDPYMEACLVGLRHQLYREFQPLKQISVETINEVEAAESPYVECLRNSFEVRRDYKIVRLHRKMGRPEERKPL